MYYVNAIRIFNCHTLEEATKVVREKRREGTLVKIIPEIRNPLGDKYIAWNVHFKGQIELYGRASASLRN